jgi:hypothetical protein
VTNLAGAKFVIPNEVEGISRLSPARRSLTGQTGTPVCHKQARPLSSLCLPGFFALLDQLPEFAGLAQLGVFGHGQFASEKEIPKSILV